MILIFFLCLKLSILHLSVALRGVEEIGYQCEEHFSNVQDTIFLVKDTSSINRILNDRFRRACQYFYNLKQIHQENLTSFANVIYFGMPDYYDGKPLEGFVYAGNVSNTNFATCNATNASKPKYDCHEIAKLVSKPILNIGNGTIYNLVQRMDITDDIVSFIEESKLCIPPPEKPINRTTVLLCVDDSQKTVNVNIKPLKLIITRYCQNYLDRNKNRLLAILVPRPFKVASEFSVPTIFYKTPFMSLEIKADFPNSMNLAPWRLLKYGFLKFIQKVGWQRVAIVSDYSELSIEMENELTELFTKEQIVHMVFRCEDAGCDTKKIKNETLSAVARIIIANVEERNAIPLIKSMPWVTWLAWDLDPDQPSQYQFGETNVFSVRLNSIRKGRYCDVDSDILTGLSAISRAYKAMTSDDLNTEKKLHLFRRLTDRMKQMTPKINEAIAFVYRIRAIRGQQAIRGQVILEMHVNTGGAEVITYNDPFKTVKTPIDGPNCLVKTYKFKDPCDDNLVLILMFVILLFTCTFIMITCFFDNNSPVNDVRYQNF